MGSTLDSVRYGELLAKATPKVIENDDELEACAARMEEIDRRRAGGKVTVEEIALRDLLAQLVKAYDDEVELPEEPPHKIIAFLMEHRGQRQTDLVPEVFGSRAEASDVVAGRRAPSKAHIKKLAKFFGLSTDVFF